MNFPAILFGFILSSLIGLLFHLWKGGSLGKLIYFLILSWIGFLFGQFIANRFNVTFGIVGQVNIGTGTLVSIIFLFIGYWLSLIEVKGK